MYCITPSIDGAKYNFV